jgi:DNA-binding beta-propeller fold protein YncE
MYVATVTTTGRSVISVFDTATCNAGRRSGCSQRPAIATITDGDGSGATMELAVNRLTNTVYVARVTVREAGQTVYVLDGATCNASSARACSVRATVALGTTVFGDLNPRGIAVAEATNTVYTANLNTGEGPGSVSIIDGAICNGHDVRGCGQTPRTAPTGFGTTDIAIDPVTRHLYTANDEDTSVTTIDGNTCRAQRTDGCARSRTDAIVGDYPRWIGVDPTTRTAYVSVIEGVSVMRLGRTG